MREAENVICDKNADYYIISEDKGYSSFGKKKVVSGFKVDQYPTISETNKKKKDDLKKTIKARLVSDKKQSSYIKPYVEEIEQQIMFAEKSWGTYKVINIQKNSLTILVTLNPGHSMKYHSHDYRNEVWTIISGKGKTIIDGMEQIVHPGDVITMEAGCKHTVIAETELKIVEVQLGKEIDVHDKHVYDLES